MGEAQTAIIVVTDLVGSTAIRREVGEDAAEELRRRHDEMLAAAVAEHDGVVVKSLGDGILARFSGAASAVAGACAMQQRVDGRFDIRIGVSAGDVTLEDGDCFGSPVIEASRLCDRADGGQILVADITRMLARGRGGHVFESVGELELKGLGEPVSVSQVVWDRSRYNRVRFPEELRVDGVPFAGRRRDVEGILHAWRAAVERGAPQVVLVSGGAGIGKSRLMAQTAATIHGAGGTVLYGRCGGDDARPQRALADALTPLVADLPDHVVEAHVQQCHGVLTRLVPIFASRVPGLEQPPVTDGDSLEATGDAVVDLLRRTGEVSAVMLILEDMHLADDDTASLFRRLARSDDLGTVLLVGTYRHDDVHRSQPFGATLADLRRMTDIERIRLRGLELDEVVEMICAARGGDRGHQTRALAADIHRETEGNPFFVDDALRRLGRSGATFRPDRSTRVALGVVGGVSFVVSFGIVAALVAGEQSGSALSWVMYVAAAAFFAGAGTWLLLQTISTVSVGPQGLGVRATHGLRVITVPWEDIDSIGWRPPPRWLGGPGGFFVETRDGRRLSNPLIDHPTAAFAESLHDACVRHRVDDVALRAKWPRLRALAP